MYYIMNIYIYMLGAKYGFAQLTNCTSHGFVFRVTIHGLCVSKQARRKQLSIGPAGTNERAKHPLGCLGHAHRKSFGFQTF